MSNKSKSILEIDTPKSCNECKLGFLDSSLTLDCMNNDLGEVSQYTYENTVHKKCPLQPKSPSSDDVKEALSNLREYALESVNEESERLDVEYDVSTIEQKLQAQANEIEYYRKMQEYDAKVIDRLQLKKILNED